MRAEQPGSCCQKMHDPLPALPMMKGKYKNQTIRVVRHPEGANQMPYKNPEHKRQWEREHREQRNARRRMQRSDERSRQHTSPKSTFDLRTALRSARKPATDPVSCQKSKDDWKTILGWAVGIGVVLLAAFAGVSLPDSGTHGSGTPK